MYDIYKVLNISYKKNKEEKEYKTEIINGKVVNLSKLNVEELSKLKEELEEKENEIMDKIEEKLENMEG